MHGMIYSALGLVLILFANPTSREVSHFIISYALLAEMTFNLF
jgi:hypothetical protein